MECRLSPPWPGVSIRRTCRCRLRSSAAASVFGAGWSTSRCRRTTAVGTSRSTSPRWPLRSAWPAWVSGCSRPPMSAPRWWPRTAASGSRRRSASPGPSGPRRHPSSARGWRRRARRAPSTWWLSSRSATPTRPWPTSCARSRRPRCRHCSTVASPAPGPLSDAVTVLCPISGPAQPFGGPRSEFGARVARATYDALRSGMRDR